MSNLALAVLVTLLALLPDLAFAQGYGGRRSSATNITTSTATDLTGYLKGNGSDVDAQAVPIPIADGGTNASSFTTSNGVTKYDGTRLVTGVWVDDGTLLYSTTATGLGLGTATPKTWLSTTATGSVLQISSSDVSRFVASGSDATVELIDTGNAADRRWLQFVNSAGLSSLRRMTDANSVAVTYWSADLTTDVVTLGSASVAGVNYISGTGNHTFSDGNIIAAVAIGTGSATYAAAPIGTVGSGTGVTVNATGDYRRVTNKVTLTYAAWAAAATTADKTIYTLAAKQRLVGIVADVTAAFTGGAVSDADMTCGKTAGGAEYLASFDVDTAIGTYGLLDADLGTALNRAAAIQGGDLPSWTATTAITCRLTTVGANTDALTAGSVTFYITTEMF